MQQAIKWWEVFGFCSPNLRRLAIRVLSQGTCTSPCERNWSTFSLIHTKRRNRLTHAHVEKLVYIHKNHRLIRKIKESGLFLKEVIWDMINKEGDDDRLLTMQREYELIIDESDENHEENVENIDCFGDEIDEDIEETSEDIKETSE